MPRKQFTLSGYKAMWVLAMFDLPVKTKRDRRNYARFRNHLLDSGFMQLQFSVYGRFCASEDLAETHRERIERALPPEGHVRLLAVTDRQFEKMRVFYGEKQHEPEQKPSQLTLF